MRFLWFHLFICFLVTQGAQTTNIIKWSWKYSIIQSKQSMIFVIYALTHIYTLHLINFKVETELMHFLDHLRGALFAFHFSLDCRKLEKVGGRAKKSFSFMNSLLIVQYFLHYTQVEDSLTHLFTFAWFLYLLECKFKQTPHYFKEIMWGSFFFLFDASFSQESFSSATLILLRIKICCFWRGVLI